MTTPQEKARAALDDARYTASLDARNAWVAALDADDAHHTADTAADCNAAAVRVRATRDAWDSARKK